MLGRDIKFPIRPVSKTSEKLQIFYIKELPGVDKLWRPTIKSPPSAVQVGMPKIRATTFFGKYWVDFSSNSTIHGFNHTTAPRRHPMEKILTIFFIIGALCALILLSQTFWIRYQNDASVINMDHEYRKFEVTKPSSIICPVPRIDVTKFSEVFKKHNIPDTREARDFFTFLSNATYKEFSGIPDFTIVESSKWLSILNDLKLKIQIKGYEDSQLTWLATERGLCFTYNNYASVYSSLEYWQQNNWTVVPHRPFPTFDYRMRILTETIAVPAHGISMHFIYPGDTVQFYHDSYHGPAMTLVTVRLLVAEVSASDEVQHLSIKQRKCRFPTESSLKLWPIYTYSMCHLECRYNRILQLCGCYPHYARPTPGIPICNSAQLRCIGNNAIEILSTSRAENHRECDCYPDCDTARYFEELLSNSPLKEGSPTDAVTTIPILIPTDKFKREQIFGFNDFLASVGGAAGLFLGASVISFIEIIYFATIRLFFYLKNEVSKT